MTPAVKTRQTSPWRILSKWNSPHSSNSEVRRGRVVKACKKNNPIVMPIRKIVPGDPMPPPQRGAVSR